MLILMAGLPGTGKSTLAHAAAPAFNGAVLNKDKIRAAVFAPADVEYSAAQDDFVMDLMLDAARYLLARDPARWVFLDGRTFSQAYQRARARSLGHPTLIVECHCRPETALARIAAQTDHPAANRDAALYHRVAAAFDPIDQAIRIDTDQPLDQATAQLLAALRAAR